MNLFAIYLVDRPQDHKTNWVNIYTVKIVYFSVIFNLWVLMLGRRRKGNNMPFLQFSTGWHQEGIQPKKSLHQSVTQLVLWHHPGSLLGPYALLKSVVACIICRATFDCQSRVKLKLV